MNYSENEIKIIIDKYIDFVDSLNYNYTEEIKNLLYIIVPAFVIRYSLDNEKMIRNTFTEVPILQSKETDENVPAYYTAIPEYIENNLKIFKAIIIRQNQNGLVGLLDSLVHEYNHALNSYNNPYYVKDEKIYIRTGLCYLVYDNKTLEAVKKEDSFILEEVLNTYQTEQIINIIHSFKKYTFTNPKINTALYFLDNHIKDKFDSEAYYIEKFFSEDLLKNKTFTSTLSNLRLKGYIEDIEYWFNNITGIKDSYNIFINNMLKINDLKFKKTTFKFQERKIRNKIISIYKEEKQIIETFNSNCN